MQLLLYVCVHVCTSWEASVMDVAHWQPDAKQTPQLSPPYMMDTTGGHTHIQEPYALSHTYTQRWFINNIFPNCSFGSGKHTADVTGHSLCTNYVWDSWEWRGPCQQSHYLLPKRKRQMESILQHQRARSVQNRSRACARNGLAARKRHLWTKMDAHLTPASSLLCLHGLLNFPNIHLITGEKILVSWRPSSPRGIPHIPHGLNTA